MLQNFAPIETKSIAATSSSGSVQFSSAVTGQAGVTDVMVYNAGPNTAFIKFGKGSASAALTDMPIAPGLVIPLSKGGADYMAAICNAAQTATVYFTAGIGY